MIGPATMKASQEVGCNDGSPYDSPSPLSSIVVTFSMVATLRMLAKPPSTRVCLSRPCIICCAAFK